MQKKYNFKVTDSTGAVVYNAKGDLDPVVALGTVSATSTQNYTTQINDPTWTSTTGQQIKGFLGYFDNSAAAWFDFRPDGAIVTYDFNGTTTDANPSIGPVNFNSVARWVDTLSSDDPAPQNPNPWQRADNYSLSWTVPVITGTGGNVRPAGSSPNGVGPSTFPRIGPLMASTGSIEYGNAFFSVERSQSSPGTTTAEWQVTIQNDETGAQSGPWTVTVTATMNNGF